MNQQDEVQFDQEAAWRALVFLLQAAREASPASRRWGPECKWEGYPQVVTLRTWNLLVSKVKEMANLDQGDRVRPQRGSFKISLGQMSPRFAVEVVTVPLPDGGEFLELAVPRRSVD